MAQVAAAQAGMTRDQALAAAKALARQVPAAAKTPSHLRAKVLQGVADGIRSEREAFARLICEEVGKPIKEARREADRAAFTFAWAADEALRWGGQWMPVDFDPASEGRIAMVRRSPRGVCLFICPFNFPLNLVAHKVAPAIAVGAPFFLKPAPQAPKTAAALERLILAAGWPREYFVVGSPDNAAAEALVKDESFAVLSFTGSASVGWHLKAVSGKKHVVLELGGNAAAVVAKDADLPWAAARCAWGAFYYSGQVCISVQRVLIEAAVYAGFRELFLKNVDELVIGDPADEKTDVAPLIDERAAVRVESWIQEAVAGGGKAIVAGPRKGRLIPPTVIESPPKNCKLTCEEAFGPVVTLEKVPDVETALADIAAGEYGLQAGLFTKDLGSVLSAWAEVPVGGLIVNDIPSFRSDAMPYGGCKGSGIGREGVRWAMEEFTEPRTMVLRP